ncbi:MAG: rhodanese-like domain-containing protein [Actinomycetota bacterium]
MRELKEHLDRYQIVDVREPYEWEVGRIDGSVLIPLNDLLAGREQGQLDDSRPIAAVCKVGNRSELAAVMLRARGYEAENLEGGLDAWAAEGYPLSAPDGGPGSVL